MRSVKVTWRTPEQSVVLAMLRAVVAVGHRQARRMLAWLVRMLLERAGLVEFLQPEAVLVVRAAMQQQTELLEHNRAVVVAEEALGRQPVSVVSVE
jgi:hypothetical protein